jgi:drug/metabolite transporter (DMT)-like permease
LTGLSVALVPVISYFIIKQKPTYESIIGVVFAVFGLFLLAFADISAVNIGDFLALLCAFAFGFHIVYTGKFSSETSVLNLVLVQLMTVALLSGVFAIFYEPAIKLENVLHVQVIWALIITSVFATAFAFITQTFLQKSASPSKVALIFATEPVFAAIADFIWNGNTLGTRAVIGCLLILVGMILAEIPFLKYFSLLKTKNQNASM